MAKTFGTLTGIIYDSHNISMANVVVQAFDKDLRNTQLLGKVKTDGNGKYSIRYDAAKYAHSDNRTADVFIRVTKDKVVLGDSPVYYNVPTKFTIDFKIGDTPIRELNEFDALVQKKRIVRTCYSYL